MGLFDKIKNVKNAITGGGAEVTVEVGEVSPDGDLPIRITALAKADVKAKRVYVQVQSIEAAIVEDIDVYRDGRAVREQVEGQMITQDIHVDIAGECEIANGATEVWEGSIELPEDGAPSFYGHIIKHTWHIKAGLDTFGNDPDSGWIEFEV